MQIVKLDSIPEAVFDQARVKPKGEDRHAIRTGTTSAVAICRDNGEAICVIGTRPVSFTDPWAVMWVSWLGKNVTLGEYREGHKLWEDWFATQGSRIVEVDPEDAVANRFVRWLGFHFWQASGGFNVYRKG